MTGGQPSRYRATPLLLFAAFSLMPGALRAQTIVGRVVDDARDAPLPGAVVRLVDQEGVNRAFSITDSVGGFSIEPPAAGEYVLDVIRLGYHRTRSPRLALHMGGSVQLDLAMAPLPLGLEGLEVAVERPKRQLSLLGVRPADLGARWIDREFIESIMVKRDLGSILEWRGVAGIQIIRRENLTTGSDPMPFCVSLSRSRSFTGGGRCALLVLDGVPLRTSQGIDIDPDGLESMAVLMPVEATTLWGHRASGGAIVMWSRGMASR